MMRKFRENLSMITMLVTLAVITLFAAINRHALDRDVVVPLDEHELGQRVRIVFSAPGNDAMEKAFDQLIRAFERKHPKIDVKFRVAPGGRDFHFVIGTLIAGRKAPDVFWFEDEPFPEFASSGSFLPLDAYIRRDGYDVEDFFELAQSVFQYQGVTYGFSQGWGAMILLYNKDILEERGVVYSDDWTWDDFPRICRRLTFDRDGDGDIDVYGYGGRRNFSLALSTIWSTGAEVLTPDKTRWTLTTPDVIRAFEWWCGLYLERPPITPEGAETHDPSFATVGNPFFAGRVAMHEAASYYCGMMRSHTRFRWGIGYPPMCPDGPDGTPHRRTRLYGDGYVIWDRYPPNWMVNDRLLTRGVIEAMSPRLQEHLTGRPTVAGMEQETLQELLLARKTRIEAPMLAGALLEIWEDPVARVAMNDELRQEMIRRDKAWEFLKYVAGVPGQRLIARMGRSTPGRKSVAYSRYYDRQDTSYDEKRMVDAINFGHLQPLTANYGDVDRVFRKYVSRVFIRDESVFKRLTPREALIQMEAELNAMFARINDQ